MEESLDVNAALVNATSAVISVSAEATREATTTASEDEAVVEKYECHHCELPFKTEKTLKIHLKSEHTVKRNDRNGSEIEKLKCSTCAATFRTSRMLR